VFEALFTHPPWAYRTGTFAFASDWPLWPLCVAIPAGAILIAVMLWRRRTLGWGRLLTLGILQAALLGLVLCLVWRPVLNVERVRDRENVLALALDASASMAYGDESRSRLQQAVTAMQGGPLEQLRKTFDVRFFGFARDTVSLPAIDAVPPPGTQTRIGDALVQVLQTAGSMPLAGIVLFSDGAENGDTLNEARLAEIASYGVPIHTVGLGPERTLNDLELERVDVPAIAPAGATVSAAIGIRHDGAVTTRLRVYDQDTLLATRELKLPADSEISTFDVELPAGEAGTRNLRFALDPLPGERNVINNTQAHVMTVPARRRSVLYLEGEPRWEYKFLRRAVESERSLRLASLVRTTPNKNFRQGILSRTELERGFPADAAELFAYDAVIIGSYEAASLSSEQHRLLRDFVDRRGGSLLLLAGRNGLSAGGWSDAPIAQTLPTRLPAKDAGSFVQRAAQASPTIYGEQMAIARFDADARRNAELWKALPPLADFQSLGRPKVGAMVLLDAVAGNSRTPLLVWQHYGRGATYVFGTASTLRWQMRLPPEDLRHELFWRQFLHALADPAPTRTALTADRTVYNDEHSVLLEAEVRNERFEPVNDAEVELLIAPEQDAAYTRTMRASGEGDGRYVAAVDAAATGLYRMDMSARVQGVEVGSATTHVRRADGVLEHFATRQNRPLLERLSAMTGGRYWTLDQLAGLTAAIPYSKAGIVQRQMLDLWNLPIVFIVLLLLKLSEWLLRLKWGRL